MMSLKDMPSASSVFSAYASMSASIMLVRTMVNQLVPNQVQQYIISAIRHHLKPRASKFTLVIEENNGMTRNQIYDASEVYLCTKGNPNTERLKISKSSKEKHVTVKFDRCETIVDSFEGIELQWMFVSEELQRSTRVMEDDSGNCSSWQSEKRHFELSFDKKYKDQVLESYLPSVLDKAKAIKDEKRAVKLHTLAHSSYSGPGVWESVNLEHPTTFDKLAMDLSLKKAVIDDLDRFVERKEFYRKVGKAWKRGYLLYGPPGTGKSSLVAAMANHLKFDIYDLQLMNIRNDSSLRKLLLSTANRSILVIEDIDCSVDLPDRNVSHSTDRRPLDFQFSLSGLLNFIDGLWSSCGDERIIVFTTNNKERLDPALLRPGRMDMHIHMSYLTNDGFKLLASNYLDINDHHWRFGEIKELIESTNVTPAEAAEELMKSSDADLSLRGLVKFLKRKKMESNEVKDKGTDGTELQEAKRLKSIDDSIGK